MKLTGQILQEARERKKMTLTEVAFATKINLKILQSIEDGDQSALPPKAFVRGFVKVYAEYLKLDVASVLAQFSEEMGSTKPTLSHQSSGDDPMSSSPLMGNSKEGLFSGRRELMKYAVAGVGILVLIVTLITTRIVQRYETEKNRTKIEKIADKDLEPTKEVKTEGEVSASPSVSSAPAVTAPVTGAPTVPAGTTGTSSAGVATGTPVQQTPVSATTPPPPVVAPPKVVTPSPTTTTTTTSTTTTTTTTMPVTKNGRPQEVILEALDQVGLVFTLDDGSKQSVRLEKNQVQTMKAKNKIALEVTDGGAVNLIHNGQDKGVPGKLGSPLKLQFPK